MRLYILLSAFLTLAACELLGPGDQIRVLRALTTAEQQVVQADNRFGLKLFRALNAEPPLTPEDPPQNLFISPLSISMALGMTLNGASGETYDAMRRTLEHNGLSEAAINAAYRSLIDLLENLDPKVIFEIANSIWFRDSFQVEQEFLDVNKNYFDAEVAPLDFDSPDAVDVINRWVDTNTRGKIDKIINQIGRESVMFLINAIYFKGTWMYEFDEQETRGEPFHNLAGPPATVQMMKQTGDLPYFETERFQAVDLPYGDSLFSMTIILPPDTEQMDSLVADLDDKQWKDWSGQFKRSKIRLSVPRFKLEYEKTLNDILSALGMEIAFGGGANFTRIDPSGGLSITFVKHKSFVEVNEEGTEAAAVTIVGIERTSVPNHAVMTVNRPFLFAIREQHSGTILFIGKVVKL